ncbi:MAG: STAS domain-containing protein, partial [Comamonadaceae bacterium]
SSTLTGPEPARVRDVRAYADTVPGHAAPPAPPPAPAVTESGALSGLHPSRLMTDTAIEEAAIRFAHGDDAGCEAILLQAIAPGSQTIDHDDSWRALLDMYRATGDVEKFERSRIRYVQRFGRLGPDWLSLRMLARDALAVARQDPASPAAPAVRGPDWNCPAHLTREGLVELTRALGAAPGPTWVVNWRSLASIDGEAAGPLKALFTHWANTPVSLRFIGVQRLMVVLAAATPPNDRRTDLVWWELRMSALRLTQDPDDFELVALNYCLTYEVSPPAWQDPVSSYSTPDPSASPAPAPPAAPRGLSLAMSGGAAAPAEPVAPKIAATLAGDILGDSLATWQRLDQDLAGVADPVISCAALVRVDFAAAGTLLTWVTERDARGERVEFVEAHRLMAALFNVVGIADHATVTPRND